MNGDFIKDLHFHKIFNHLNDGIFIADQYGYAIWVNETSTKQIGAPRSKIIGKHVDDLESKGFFTPSVTKIVLEKKDVVSKVQTSNGRQFLATGYPVQIKEDNTGYILVHVKDITETVKTTFQLEKAEALIQQYWQELQRMKSAYQQNNEESNIIGQSKKHEKMINMISRLSDVDATILLTGESGVGKSRIAEEIHKRSSRSKNKAKRIKNKTVKNTTAFSKKLMIPCDILRIKTSCHFIIQPSSIDFPFRLFPAPFARFAKDAHTIHPQILSPF